ncbi:ubiquitin carboxyl-terminal hydrolase 33-like [Cimex lectularius]|uniref:Ubiquitin carboxyl-terminal hydrolase n=1 Tax=Cimex lectularius TaxID=79782 RepID=A0A8I6RAA4_CIMLE|nr:ubiquitin carboxyl-terminal hydrolase 33-like [Cimex lectularius]
MEDSLEGLIEPTTCTHILEIEKEHLIGIIDDFDTPENSPECYTCNNTTSIWLCLHKDCKRYFCSKNTNHQFNHYKADERHCLQLDTSNLSFYCHECQVVIYITERLRLVEVRRGGWPRGVIGLPNLGNTCYMNSALQALLNSPPLVSYFISRSLDSSRPGRRREGSLSTAFQQLVICMLSRKTPPPNLLFMIRSAHPMFRGFQQHDSQEFLRCFMDGLHEEMKKISMETNHQQCSCETNQQQKNDETEESDDADDYYESCDSDVSEKSSLSFSRSASPLTTQEPPSDKHGKCKKNQCKSIISDIFDGIILSSVQCLTCNRVSTRVETFQDLSLPIPSRDHLNLLHQSSNQATQKCSHYGNEQGWYSWFMDWLSSWFWGPTVSLHDCLSAFFSADELKGDNMYSCEKCRKLRNGIKFSKMVKTPEILCVHLKRFRHDHVFSSKIASHIKFPMEGLDLKPYIDEDSQDCITRYNLISVICHHGTSGSGGHYTTYALNSSTNQWYHYDDMLVTKVSWEVVNSCQAYVLFYRREAERLKKYRTKFKTIENNNSDIETTCHVANFDED